MVHLVRFFQPSQDRDGVFHGRLADEDLLEATLESRVLFDVLAILIEGRGADQSQLPAGQQGLDHVARVHRAFAGPGAHDGVQLVDEGDDLALGVLDLF